jgi:hypothetical protein
MEAILCISFCFYEYSKRQYENKRMSYFVDKCLPHPLKLDHIKAIDCPFVPMIITI